MAKVAVNKESGCWEWTAHLCNGYGRFCEKRKVIPAHWFLLNPRPDKGQLACHKCDNPKCVNPAHIFLGTSSDNALDCSKKGRRCKNCYWMIGERNHHSKLKNEEVALIKALPKGYGVGAKIARHLGITKTLANQLRNDEFWKHIQPSEEDFKRAKRVMKKLNIEPGRK